MSEEQISPEKRDDWREVRTYLRMPSITDLCLPLSNRLVKDTHAT